MKYILVIGDGMADHPLDTLGGRTPLEASKKDAIDALARHGILGSVRNVPEGFAPGSDTAIMSIFGCSPRKYFFGRAPLEAAASGIRLAPGDACYRCNMVTYADEDVPFEHKHIISHSAGSIEGRESDELVTMLFNHPDFRPLAEQAGMVIHKGSSFRHLAVQSHVDIKGIQLAPPHDHLGEEIGPILPTGCPNADVLREIKPHQIYAAGDLADPHGTHRTCMEAVLGALEVVKDDEWLKECHLWLYRGAWMEWDLGMVDMAVPLSPDELIMKRHAIYRHLSQKDIMPFPGSDPREFWQRAEERTQNTAKLYDQLGMAEYQAIEVFVKMF